VFGVGLDGGRSAPTLIPRWCPLTARPSSRPTARSRWWLPDLAWLGGSGSPPTLDSAGVNDLSLRGTLGRTKSASNWLLFRDSPQRRGAANDRTESSSRLRRLISLVPARRRGRRVRSSFLVYEFPKSSSRDSLAHETTRDVATRPRILVRAGHAGGWSWSRCVRGQSHVAIGGGSHSIVRRYRAV
jgi:hypothetical protein